MRTSKIQKSNLIKTSATFLVAFLFLALFSAASNTSAVECIDGVTSSGVCGTDTADVHVSVEGGWAISVSSAGTLGVDVSPTTSGVLSTVVDNVNVYTNIPTGYQLYLNSTSGSTDIYNNSVLDGNGNLLANLPANTNTNHFVATFGTKDNPIALSSNTWGYSLDNSPTTFAKVALTNDDADSNIYSNSTKTSSSGDNIPVTYGFKADTSLAPGTYSTQVTYTAIADVPTYAITSVSPSTLQQDDQTNKTITIMTSTPSSELAFGEVSAKIGTVDLMDCSEITSDGYRGVTCTYSGSLTPGYYTIELTSTWHNATYTKTNAITLYQKTMQTFTTTDCSNLKESTTTQDNRTLLKDSRDGKTYAVSKLKDGKCWMSSNLALDGTDASGQVRVLTTADSNVTANRPLAKNVADGTVSDPNLVQIYSKLADNTTDVCDLTTAPYCLVNTSTKYGNLYNWPAATAGVGKSTTTGVVTESVCPKSWALPDSQAYYNLINVAYGYTMYTFSPETTQAMLRPPFYFTLSGVFDGTAAQQRQTSRYSTRNSNNNSASGNSNTFINMLDTNTMNGVTTINGWENRKGAIAVRCVFGG